MPAHVPSHWSMVLIDFKSKRVQFHDSLPSRLTAADNEQQVHEEVTVLLELLGLWEPATWDWIGESVGTFLLSTK